MDKTTENDDNVKLPEVSPVTHVKIKKPRKLTSKQKAFIKHLIDNPKASGAAAARAAYNVTTDLSARQQAHDNLTNPNVVAELAKYSDTAEITLIEVMNKSKEMMNTEVSRAVDWAVNARQTADSLLDRVHGKSTQRTEVTTRAVTLNIDLSADSLTDTDTTV